MSDYMSISFFSLFLRKRCILGDEKIKKSNLAQQKILGVCGKIMEDFYETEIYLP